MYIFEQILVFWFNILFFIDFQKLYDQGIIQWEKIRVESGTNDRSCSKLLTLEN